MAEDEDERVRYQVLHNMCDGSPPGLEDRVIETLEIFNRDKCEKVRRKAHQVIASYDHTADGKYNIM